MTDQSNTMILSRRQAFTGAAAGTAAIVAGTGKASARHPDDDLRHRLRSLLDYLRTDTKCTVGTHYDRQMIGNQIQAMLGEGGEAAGAPAIAIAADPDERLRAAVQEFADAMQARWPDRTVEVMDFLDAEPGSKPSTFFVVHPWPRQQPL